MVEGTEPLKSWPPLVENALMALEGSLEAFSIVDVLALLAGSGRTGELLVRTATTRTTIVICDGAIGGVRSDLDAASADPVLTVFELLLDRTGTFRFVAQPVDGPLELVDLGDLLRGVDRLAGEWEELVALAPTVGSAIELCAQPPRAALVIDVGRWELVKVLAPGPMTLAQLVATLGIGELETRRRVLDAFNAGLLTVDGRTPAPTNSPTGLPLSVRTPLSAA